MKVIIDTKVLKRECLYDEIADILECYGEPCKTSKPQGKWIIDGHHYKCSQCGKTLALMFSETDDGDLIGCPFCLAKMRKGTENGD